MKWIIISILILIIILSVVLLLLPKQENKVNQSKDKSLGLEEDNNELQSAEELGIVVPEEETNIEPGYQEYYTVSNCISQYLDMIDLTNSSYYGKDENGNTVQSVSQEEINERVRCLLSSNSDGNIEMLEQKNMFIPVDIVQKTQGNVQSYCVYGITCNTKLEYLTDIYFIVNLDTANNTFSIERLNGDNLDITQISVTELENIEKNDYNTFSYQKVDEQYKYKKIFDSIKKLILVKPELAYQYLDDDFKAQRFGSYDSFMQYIQNNKEHIIGITPKRYKVEEDETKILLMDQYLVWYEFELTGTMKYKVKLDNYIQLFDTDLEQYNKYSAEDKIKYNINRWIKMLNSKDYYFAYQHLDETFRKENYETEDDFAQFMQDKYPDWYDDISINLQKDGNVYTAEVELNVDGEEFSDKYMTIFMQLEDDTNFTMSFDAQ